MNTASVKPGRQRDHFLMVRHRANVRRVFLWMAGMLQ